MAVRGSHGTPAAPSERRSPVQWAAIAVGLVFLVVGVLGFIPGITTNYSSLSLVGHHSDARLLGLFNVSILHNVVHLLFGMGGLAWSATFKGARGFLIAGSAIYAVLWPYGLALDQQSAANLVPVNSPDNFLHLGLAVGMLALGLLLPRAPGFGVPDRWNQSYDRRTRGLEMTESGKADQTRKGLIDSVTGRAKEVAGAVTGNDSLTAEGQLEQTQAQMRKEASRTEAVADAEAAKAKGEATEAKLQGASARAAVNSEAASEETAIRTERAAQKQAADQSAHQDLAKQRADAERDTQREVERAQAEQKRPASGAKRTV